MMEIPFLLGTGNGSQPFINGKKGTLKLGWLITNCCWCEACLILLSCVETGHYTVKVNTVDWKRNYALSWPQAQW